MASLRETRATLPDNVRTILGEEASAGDPPVEEVAPVAAAPASPNPASERAPEAPASGQAFDLFTSEIDDPLFKADAELGPALTAEQIRALPDDVKHTLAHFRKGFTQKTQQVAEERRALQADREALEAQRQAAPPAAPESPADAQAVTAFESAMRDAPARLRVLLGKEEDPTAFPLPEKTALHELSDDDLYDPAKFRQALLATAHQIALDTVRGGFQAFVEPYEQQVAARAKAERREAWIKANPGMEDGANRKAVMGVAARLGLTGTEGMTSAYKVWRAESGWTPPAAAAPAAPAAPVVTAPAAQAAPAEDAEKKALREENDRLKKAAKQSPIDVIREFAANAGGKGSEGGNGVVPRMPDGLDPAARAEWLAKHPEVGAELRTGGIRAANRMRAEGRLAQR